MERISASRELFVSDLDGTLLDGDARLSQTSAQLLNGAIAQGVHFTVATARTPATVDVIMRNVNMTMPAIVLTGAAWWHFDKRCYTDVRLIDSATVRVLLEIFRKSGVVPFVYTLDRRNKPDMLHVFYAREEMTAIDAEFVNLRKDLLLKKFHIGESLPDTLEDAVILMFASGAGETIERAAAAIREQTQCSVSCYDDIYNPATKLIEIFAPGVSKATAIKEMARRYNLSPVTVFGDNLNDLPMFEIADKRVAVANGCPQIRRASDTVIGPNSTDSVAKYIAKGVGKV